MTSDVIGNHDSESNRVLLGRQIAEARSEAGLSVSEMARSAGCSEQYVRMLEAGVNPKTGKPSRPSESKLLGLAHAVNRDPRPWFELVGYSVDLLDGAPLPAEGSEEDYLRTLNEAARHLTERSPIMKRLALSILQSASTAFEEAAISGTVEVSAEDEPLITQQAIAECKSHLRAVSFQDDEWWNSELGDAYLAHHAQLRERNVEITRIFLVKTESIEALIPTLRRHLELGVNTYVIDLKNLADRSQHRDVVIYDEMCVREASPVDGDDLDGKDALLSDDRLKVRSALRKFENLRERAIAFNGEARVILARYEKSGASL